MDAVKRLLESSQRGERGSFLQAATRELLAAGWVHHTDRPVPFEREGRQGIGYPWWTDPVTGQTVKGLRAVLRIAQQRHEETVRPLPSAAAVRIMAALREKPALAAELRELLNREFSERERADALALAQWVASRHPM